MHANQLVSGKFFPLKITDTCGKAIDILNEYDIAHLPVIDGNKHIGHIAVSEILGHDDKTIIEPFINRTIVSKVYQYQHLFEVIKVFSETSSSALSLVDDDDTFMGIITAQELLSKVGTFTALSHPGTVLTLEVTAINYALSEISRILEYNDAKILALYVDVNPNTPSLLQITIKLNTTQIKSVISAFERYGYKILASYTNNTDTEDLKNRYQSLMKYLDI